MLRPRCLVHALLWSTYFSSAGSAPGLSTARRPDEALCVMTCARGMAKLPLGVTVLALLLVCSVGYCSRQASRSNRAALLEALDCLLLSLR